MTASAAISAVSGPKTAFISYSSRDRKEAFEIKELLEAQGIATWLDFFDINVTAELREQLAARVRESDIFCLLLSPSAVESRWVGAEIDLALAANKEHVRILPIILRPCRIPAQLDNIVGFDASEGLEYEAVRLRLIRAVCGEAAVEDGLLLDAANRLLLSNRESLLRAEAELPAVSESLQPAGPEPIREVVIVVREETLPEDPGVILELQLELDKLFHGTVSFFLARYREGDTWPAEFGFEEPPFGEFLLSDRPRLDVQMTWFDRTVPLSEHVDATDLKWLPAMFSLTFDGKKFKPKGDLNLEQVFQIPALDVLEKQHSAIRLILHDRATKQAREVLPGTDIDVKLLGRIGGRELCLYASRLSPFQRLLLQSDYLTQLTSPIRRTAVLESYAGSSADEDRRPEILAALERKSFASEEQQRLAARYRFSEANLARFQTLHRDAYQKFQEVAELLQPIVMGSSPRPADVSLMYRACRALVEIWLRQESIRQAGQLANSLLRVAQWAKEAWPDDPDYQGMWADALRLSAGIRTKLGDLPRAGQELTELVATVAGLYQRFPSTARRNAYLETLTWAARSASAWGLEDQVPLAAWKGVLAEHFGEVVAGELARPEAPEAVPRWLEEGELADWPTEPIESAALRYQLRVPRHWGAEPTVRGTSNEVEHIYRGVSAPEWLIISFMDKANAESDMRVWIEVITAITGFPVLTGLKEEPQLVRQGEIRKATGLAKKLEVDEAHVCTGLGSYRGEEGSPRLARHYIVMARRKSFAWKVALSFETACFDGMPEKFVDAQDHARARAILCKLRLG